MTHKIKGKLIFEPPKHSTKQKNESWRTVAILQFKQDDMLSYYSWFLKKYFDIELVAPMRGPHITFISEEVKFKEAFERLATTFKGKEVEIEFTGDVNTNGQHWWLRVEQDSCSTLNTFRNMLGLGKYKFNYHISLGYCKPTEVKASERAAIYLKTFYQD